ncbi:MAG: AI-2E family transporter [Nitrospirae bacterium]|nr:AI-2E family transporter [Nitrospirota bacterium]
MTDIRLSKTIYLVFTLIIVYLFYKILSPFLFTLAWAMALSITFYPLYKLILRSSRRPWSASLLTLLIILMTILVPFIFIIGSLANDITNLYNMIEQRGVENIINTDINLRIEDALRKFIPEEVFQKFNIQQSLVSTLKSIGDYILRNISGIFTNAFILVMNFIIMCMTIYYFLKDGEALAAYLKKLLPLTEEQKHRFEERIKQTVIAAVYGGLAVGVAQGALGGIAFWIFGLPSPVFWGATMAILSLVPVFGTFLVWGPACLILFLSGSYMKGIGLLLFSVIIISSVDNIIKPLVIGSRTRMHLLLVFLTVLGGMQFFGLLGFILGPLIAALFLTLAEIHAKEE